jgi:hypothetical protein
MLVGVKTDIVRPLDLEDLLNRLFVAKHGGVTRRTV